MESLKVEPLDKEEIGILTNPTQDLTVLDKYKGNKWETKYPAAFTIQRSSTQAEYDYVTFTLDNIYSSMNLIVYYSEQVIYTH